MISTKRVPNNHEPPGIHIGLRTKPPAATRAANHTKTKHKRKTAYVWRHHGVKHGQDAPVSVAHARKSRRMPARAHTYVHADAHKHVTGVGSHNGCSAVNIHLRDICTQMYVHSLLSVPRPSLGIGCRICCAEQNKHEQSRSAERKKRADDSERTTG